MNGRGGTAVGQVKQASCSLECSFFQLCPTQDVTIVTVEAYTPSLGCPHVEPPNQTAEHWKNVDGNTMYVETGTVPSEQAIQQPGPSHVTQGSFRCPIPVCGGKSFTSHIELLGHFLDTRDGHQLKASSKFNTGHKTVNVTCYRQPDTFRYRCPCHMTTLYTTEDELKKHLLTVEHMGGASATAHGTREFTKPCVPSMMTKAYWKKYT